MKKSAEQFRTENPEFKGTIPIDAVTASGSGLDPDISLANAEAQSARVAKARGIDPAQVNQLIATVAEKRDAGCLGEARVNVLKLNLALDSQRK